METDKKTKRKQGKWVTLALTGEDRELFEKVAAAVGLNKTELVRRMLYKLSIDEKGQDIIRRGYITSHNVHYVDKENGAAEPRSDAESSSMDSTENIPQNTETHNSEMTLEDLRWCGIHSIKEAIEIAKTPIYIFDEN